jgi:hypothetical protein
MSEVAARGLRRFHCTAGGPFCLSLLGRTVIGAVLTLPRVRKQRDLDKELPEAPRLCNRATGSRWRPAAGSELELPYGSSYKICTSWAGRFTSRTAPRLG